MVSLDRGSARFIAFASIVLALLTFANIYDYRVFRNWVIAAQLIGLQNIYVAAELFGHGFRVVYPPLAPLLFIATASIAALVYPLYLFTSYPPLAVRLLLKAPIIASIYATHYVLKRRVSSLAAKLFTFNLIVILLVHAYVFEFPAILFAVTALYVAELSPIVTGVLLGASTLLKQTFLLLALPIALFYLNTSDKRGLAKFLAAYSATLLVATLPFLATSGVAPLLQSMVKFHAQRPPQGVVLWTLALVETGYNASFARSVSSYWLLCFLPLALFAIARLRSVTSLIDVERLAAALMIALLMTTKVLNAHYLLWALPLIAVLTYRGVISRRAYIAYTVAGVLALLYPIFVQFSAAVLHRPFYLEEECRWLEPKEVEELVIGVMPQVMPYILEFARTTPLRTFFQLIYDNWALVLPVMSLLYTGLLAYVYAELVKGK